jgi:GTP-binding protein Era
MRTGFVNIFGRPNAGKSTLLNALLGEKLAIISPKVQTTRHRIKGFLNKTGEYQVIFSDTPGIIEPKYKLHERMMHSVKGALEDADIALLIVDVKDNMEENNQLFTSLKLKVPCIVIVNKTDEVKPGRAKEVEDFFAKQPYCTKVICISALKQTNIQELTDAVVALLPEGEPFYPEDDLTDLSTKFFTGEMIREKIYQLYGDELPYHSAVIINEFKERPEIIKIQADVIVQRESQKAIMIGEGGKMIKKLGTLAREDMEKFLQQKVFLQLFIKVKPKWRDNDQQLKEYGYY